MNNIYITKEALDYPKTKEILNKIKNYKIIENEEEFKRIVKINKIKYKEEKKYLFFGIKKGKFLKKYFLEKNFMGIKEEYYLTYENNCPYNCLYCYLRDYYEDGAFYFYVNIEDMFKELDEFKEKNKMISCGIVNDSLAYDNITGITSDLMNYFRKREDLILEIRTKSNNINNLLKEEPLKNCIISFSFNPENIIKKYEHGTALFQKRIEAVRLLQEKGFNIGLRFDPMINNKSDIQNISYKEMIDEIFKNIDKNKIHDIGIGCLRYKKSLKQKVYKDEKTDIFYDEMIIGIDGKERYFKPIRLNLYKTIIKEIKKYGEFNIYLGMEPEYIWKEAFL